MHAISMPCTAEPEALEHEGCSWVNNSACEVYVHLIDTVGRATHTEDLRGGP